MARYGYCRISTKQQSIDRQVRNIKAVYPDAIIVTESYSGTTLNRPEWKKLYNKLKPNDVVVYDSVSRMSRDADEGVDLYMELYNKGIELEFLKESHINTEVYKSTIAQTIGTTGNDIADIYIEATNKVIRLLAEKQIRLAFEQAEKEVEDLHQRTREGIETARLNGKQIGQKQGAKLTTKKSVEAKKLIRKHNKTFGGSLTNEETWKLIGISKMTFYKYLKEMKEEYFA
ncbi:recombinase family protein [Lacrimispora saccharolytica]|nr:recombinase family protein [Lacrimispora saccharolytica]